MELFFDLVYVFAVTQLSHRLLEHLSLPGALQTLLLLLAVWWAWVYTAWFTNWFDPDQWLVRLLMTALMLASLFMSATLPDAFDARGLGFAAAYVSVQVARPLFAVATLRSEPRLRRNFLRILVWMVAAGCLWLAGGLAHGLAREAIWVAAIAVDYAAPAAAFPTPGLGRARTTDWDITGGHMAERCQLFVIIALGESILETGFAFGQLQFSALASLAFTVAFLSSLALWWVYFDRAALEGSAVIEQSADPGQLGRSAYTYLHLPIVAGIIVSAVGDELTILHPTGPAGVQAAAVILSGPALFLIGHALFKRVLFGRLSIARVAAIAALIAMAPLGPRLPALALAAITTLLVGSVAVADVVESR
jgi:low temperature requirement protein LtrA